MPLYGGIAARARWFAIHRFGIGSNLNGKEAEMIRNLHIFNRIVFYAGIGATCAIGALPGLAIAVHAAGFPGTAETLGMLFFRIISAA